MAKFVRYIYVILSNKYSYQRLVPLWDTIHLMLRVRACDVSCDITNVRLLRKI